MRAPCAQIESKHVALIEKMVGEYKIPSNDKAYRVAVQYAISDGNTNDIFKQKRCNTCGGRKKKVKVQIELYDKQPLYLESMKTTFGMKSVDKALRCVLEYAETDGDRATIFSEKRCKNC